MFLTGWLLAVGGALVLIAGLAMRRALISSWGGAATALGLAFMWTWRSSQTTTISDMVPASSVSYCQRS